MIKRLTAAMLCLCILLTWIPAVYAVDITAQDISSSTTIIGDGFSSFDFLFDKDINAYRTSSHNCSLNFLNEQGIGSLYLMFDLEFGEYTVTDAASGITLTAGTEGYLHEYLDLTAAFGATPTAISLSFPRGKVSLSEIYIFSEGTAPDFVQKWEAPLEAKTDILLLSTHGDDDQLFFAGLLPKYAAQQQAGVQVAYLTDHRNLTNQRTHEILNGLWAVGCTTYPVMADFPDFRIDSLNGTYREFARQGVTEEELLQYVVKLLRRFKPKVVVGHDMEGEYGHGMHMVYTDCLVKALELSNDEDSFPDIAQQYGLWDVPKTYLHLYEQDPIELDYDQPLSVFNGMTAFQVSQKLGYPCHKSQQYTWFTDWINGDNNEITKATQIRRYNPCRFGLYRSTVGSDLRKDDFLENIITYAEEDRIEQDRLEQERLEKEQQEKERLEQERLELERIEQEKAEKKRQEQERLEQERLEQQRLEQQQLERQRRNFTIIGIIAITVLFIAFILVLILLWYKIPPKNTDL